MDVLDAMKGNADGHGKGLTTYLASTDREQMDAHAECLKLEQEGKVTRYIDRSNDATTPHIIWYPVDPKDVVAPKPGDEPDEH